MPTKILQEKELLESGLFDAQWYQDTHQDVRILGMDPLQHYLWLGAHLNRSPGPRFDCEKYLRNYTDVAEKNYHPLLHYIRYGKYEGRQAFKAEPGPDAPGLSPQAGPQRHAGGLERRSDSLTVLLCAHVAGAKLFGGERSLLDMLDGLNALRFNVIVTVPGRGNSAYFETLRRRSVAVYEVSYDWWRAGQPVSERAIADFAGIMTQEGVDAVHVNTITLREPLLAARRIGVRSLVHVRELIRHDAALLQMIGEPADTIIRWIWDNTDCVIANSEATRISFSLPGRVPVRVYNTTDIDLLAALPGPSATGPVRAGLISSNLPKKGIRDFTRIASALAATHPEVRFHLIGPENEYTREIETEIEAGNLPDSIRILGYRDTPAESIAEMDVVMSLSNFQESFGRTVLEGMASARPVIAYDYGAPPELVRHERTGFVVPLQDVEAAADALRRLAEDRELLLRMGRAGQQEARGRFDRQAYVEQMRHAYAGLVPGKGPAPDGPAEGVPLPVPREKLKIAYFTWHFPVPSETFVLNELRLLVQQGHDVRVFCKQSPHRGFRPDFEIEWERVRDPDHLAERLTETGRTIVHSHFVYPTVTDMVWPACEKAQVAFTFIAHAQDIFRYRNDAVNRIGEVGRSPLCRKVFVPSRFHYRYLAGRGVPGDKIMLNPNGCDTARYADGRVDNRAARPFRHVIAIHRFTEKKGLIHLIRAARLLKEERIRVTLYGYGELEDSYRAAIEEEGITNVAFGGPVKGLDEMLARFREADLFACPSVRAEDGDMDGIPTVLMEAMAAGLPVLTTDLSGIPDLVEDGVTGFVSGAEPRAIAARIRDYYALPDPEVQKVIDGGLARLRADYDIPRLAETLLRVWSDAPPALPAPPKMTLPARRGPARIPRETLKIAYFTWHFPVPSETFVLNELRLLVQQGHDVRVFCKQSPHRDFRPDFEIEWETVRDPGHLAERLTETGRTIVHAHFIYPVVTEMVWPACEAAQIPFTCIAHAQDIFRYRNAAVNRVAEFAHSPQCLKIFTLSRFHRTYLENRGVPADKIIINSNAIEPDLFAPGKIADRPARRFRSVCAISRFAEKKGLEHLIMAAPLLAKEGITVDLYGYGPLEERYRALIAEHGITNVRIRGSVDSRAALLEVFRRYDLFVCPSVRASDGDMDGIPTTLMESMAAGLPVLTTRLSGIPDLVTDRVTGLVCEAGAEQIADSIRAFYAMPEDVVEAIIHNAETRLRANHDGAQLVDTLLRVWAGETLDLMIVSWNNLPQTSEVIRRIFRYTTLPFQLIVCDNGSNPTALAHLLDVYARHDNVTLVLNRENALVGPGTNICLEHGQSDYAVYVCGKEGMITDYGWDKSAVSYMNRHPDVGLAGTLCYSPSYLHGRDYPAGQALFPRFRNPGFATDNPDRVFHHVQGGFFVVRRAMYDEIGGFSEEVPHASTDVEYSYYVESCGWKLGEVPGLMALFNKTRPGLFHRIDEQHAALHPPRLEDLPQLDAIARRKVHHCNACGQQSESFSDLDGDALCPHCGASRRARSIHRALATSVLLYRRLLAMGVGVPRSIEPFWRQQFQGRVTDAAELMTDLASEAGRTNLADGRLDLVLLNGVLSGAGAGRERAILAEAARVLHPGGTLILAGEPDSPLLTDSAMGTLGFVPGPVKRYASGVSHYDWVPVRHYSRS